MAQEQIDVRKVKSELEDLKKKVAELSSLVEDIEFSRRTEEAWKRHDRGEYDSYSKEEFLEELEKW